MTKNITMFNVIEYVSDVCRILLKQHKSKLSHEFILNRQKIILNRLDDPLFNIEEHFELSVDSLERLSKTLNINI